MDHLSPGVDALVELEHKIIVEKYGDEYHSMHEGYAVLLEEVEEATEALREVQQHLACAWQDVREDTRKLLGSEILRVEHHAKDLAAEAVQIAAVARRWRGGLKDENA